MGLLYFLLFTFYSMFLCPFIHILMHIDPTGKVLQQWFSKGDLGILGGSLPFGGIRSQIHFHNNSKMLFAF